MAYKYQKGDATLSGSVTIEENLTVSSATTLSGLLSSSAKISGSAFYGSGAALTGIVADSFEVDDTNANTEFKLVGVSATGAGVTLVAMNDGSFPAFNASTGKVTIKGAQEVDGALQVDGASTLSHLTASKGGLFNGNISVADGKKLSFAGEGYIAATSAGTGEFAINMPDNVAEGFMIRVDGDKNFLTIKTDNSDERVTSDVNFYASSGLEVAGTADLKGTVNLGDAGSDVITVTGHLTASKGGKFTLGVDCDSTLNVDGALTANGTVTLGNAASDVTTVTGHLTASKGILSSEEISIPSSKTIAFNGAGGTMKITANSGTNMNLNAPNNFVFNPGGHAILADTTNTVDLGSSGVQWKDLYVDGLAYIDQLGEALDVNGQTISNVGHLTASKGGLFSDDVQIATGKELKFVGNGAIDFSSAATGNAYISMADNLAEAFFIAQGANTYFTCVTSNGDEAVIAGKDFKIGDAVGKDVFLSIYSGVEYHGQELVTGNKTVSDLNRTHYICSGSSAVTLTLPAAETGYSAFVKRHPSMTNNVKVAANGSETIDGVTTDLVLETAGAAVQLVASGSAWYVY